MQLQYASGESSPTIRINYTLTQRSTPWLWLAHFDMTSSSSSVVTISTLVSFSFSLELFSSCDGFMMNHGILLGGVLLQQPHLKHCHSNSHICCTSQIRNPSTNFCFPGLNNFVERIFCHRAKSASRAT